MGALPFLRRMTLAHEPNSKIIKAIETLQIKNPSATEGELRALFVQLRLKDEALAEIVVDDVFKAECDQIYGDSNDGDVAPLN
jgi:hypothetical protein